MAPITITITPRPILAVSTLLLLLAHISPTADARKSLGGGSGLSSWSTNEDEGLFAGAARGARDGQRRDALCRPEWVVDPLTVESVTSKRDELGRDTTEMVCRFLATRDPLRVRLRARPVRAGSNTGGPGGGVGVVEPGEPCRAAAMVSSRSPKKGGGAGIGGLPLIGGPKVRRVRAQWSTMTPKVLAAPTASGGGASSPLLSLDYETASQTNNDRLEIEIVLPRVRSTGKNPSVVYTFPISEGNINEGGYIPASRGTVRVYPAGRVRKAKDSFEAGMSAKADPLRDEQDDDDDAGGGGVDVPCKVGLHSTGGPGLVDPQWAKGRKTFWKGRRVGVL